MNNTNKSTNKNLNSELILLFPIPVSKFQLDRNFTKEEKNFFKIQNYQNNYGNQRSVCTNILDSKELKNLKNEIQLILEEYIFNVLKISNKNMFIKITQSWLNKTKTNQFHHRHNHANSFVSGVLYIDTDETTDKIFFYKTDYKQIDPQFYEITPWNASAWWLPVKTSSILLFPSNIEHSVDNVLSKQRISLAFNSFLFGSIGSEERLTELIIT